MEALHPPELAAWPDEAVAVVRRLAEDAATLRRRCEQLEQALGSRVAIEQAKGVLAERLGISVDEAFDVLRRAARTARARIQELAREVVDSPATPPPVARELARRRRQEGAR